MSSRPGRFVLLSALVTAAMAPVPVEANVGAPWWGGTPAGEPLGIDAIHIAREDLVIDLRPLATAGGLVSVAATYHLDNPSAEKHLDLVFATGSIDVAFQVTLDGRPVPSTATSGASLPESWRPPRTTPLFDDGELPYELRGEAIPVGFRIDVPPGRHALAISYRADAVRYHRGDPTILRQFAYVLSPARTWAGFGGLDVTIHVPPGWRAAVTPAMPRERDTLRAAFAAIPADAIAITVQARTGAHAPMRYAALALFALVALGGGGVVVRWTRARERRREALSASRIAALGRGIAWGGAVLAAGMLAILGPDLVVPDGQADHRGHGRELAFVGVVLASIAAAAIGAIASLIVGNRVHAARIAAPAPTAR
ncbi:MAG TPA: hypothetical protein VK932_28090 [Kofleriaceae bacterium]|nr:hypothetical protein [Kofleriaceae bacterium]